MTTTNSGGAGGNSGTINLGGILLPASPFAVLAFGIWGTVDLSKAYPAQLPPIAGLLAIVTMVMSAALYPIATILVGRVERAVEAARTQASGCALGSVRWAQVDDTLRRVAGALEADVAQRQVDALAMQKVADALDRSADQVKLILQMQEIVSTMQETRRSK